MKTQFSVRFDRDIRSQKFVKLLEKLAKILQAYFFIGKEQLINK